MAIKLIRFAAALAACGAFFSTQASAQPISVRQGFPIGSGGNVLCSAQSMVTDPGLVDMFDRGYTIVCRDAAVPVGRIYALRARGGDPVARLATLRAARVNCEAPAAATIAELGGVDSESCRLKSGDVTYNVYVKRQGGTIYVAEGLGGYDSALRLALRSVVADRPVAGDVSIATTGAGDPAAFARLQAGTLDRETALAEAYRRNNAGSYAESAEFFAVIGQNRSDTDRAEALVNEALQKSNLGHYAEADALFAQARTMAVGDPVTARRFRNYRVIHLLNQGHVDEALAELDRPLPPPPVSAGVQQLVIDHDTAARLSAEAPGARRLTGVGEGLSDGDRIQVLDSQALQLRGTILHLQGHNQEAVAPFTEALDRLVAIRGGRIAATVWMRAQILDELAAIAEARGDRAAAEQQYQQAVALIDTAYPDSAALLSAQGQLAGFYARTGADDQAIALYRRIVAAGSDDNQDRSLALRRVLAPYFRLLVAHGDATSAADMFAASQVLLRPGVAQTQAVLARELSGGSDEASRLFRQSVNLTRDIERARVELARFETAQNPSAADIDRATAMRASLQQLQQQQATTQASLAQFPRFRVVAGNALGLADLQQVLRPGEAYYKMIVLDDDSYGMFVTADSARVFRIDATPAVLDQQVDQLRATISIIENGQQLTYPFNVELAYRVYEELFAPVGAAIGGVHHLIFEPDGAMLRLPPNLLVMDHAAIDAYRARVAAGGDDFDFRGMPWLGRDRDISTAVSARSFRDVREAPPSRARGEYLGFGQNAPVTDALSTASGTRGILGSGRDDCSWPLTAWSHPIAATELYTAQRAISADVSGGATDIVTGAAFSDTGIKARGDLANYRILQFATHGLVSAPRPECPARPALLTSFGGTGSDGLLTFAEIFDLRLDADLIILSACDTAGRASVAATEEAGLTTGGGFALDGLVRAFVGAGGRMIVASHWPVPDDFNATQRLISGLFTAPVGTGTATALREAQDRLMDEAQTSHPFYWAAFAVIGDGAAPVIRAPQQTASAN
jgi:CHAT domain-containing protein